ncbi:MAG: transglutaminase-like domain-containing protein [Candidatus Nanoarchaeia archaeon]|nr:transglutaminase-like domain-containing protein [Candidatus Nanoarchaeia archaeon]
MGTKVKKPYDNLDKLCVIFLIFALLASSYLAYSNYYWGIQQSERAQTLESEKNSLQSHINILDDEIHDLVFEIQTKIYEISNLEYDVYMKKEEIRLLKTRVNDLEGELGITKTRLQETTYLYEEAKPYQERVERGLNLQDYYLLLGDNQDYAKPIILQYLGLSRPTEPLNDEELWERGKKVYNWLSDNYEYCGDKGLRVGTTFYEFQFYSPDELLMSDNHRCGDCDDFATLFAGLMYASGVPEDKVWVVCGSVPEGGHCWNWLSLSSNTYRIDGVCSENQEIFNFLGLSWGIKSAYYTSTKENVDCFSEYIPKLKMNPDEYYSLI